MININLNGKKKGQEEMIGFVLIIVLVAVIGLIFLAIQIRRPAEMRASAEVRSFLESSLHFTTDCYIESHRPRDIRGLIRDCYNDEVCEDDRDACEVLNSTIVAIVESEFSLDNYAGYKLEIYEDEDTMVSIEMGNESANRVGKSVNIAGPNRIEMNVFELTQN